MKNCWNWAECMMKQPCIGGCSKGRVSKEFQKQSLCCSSSSRTRAPEAGNLALVLSAGLCTWSQHHVTRAQEILLVSVLSIHQKEGKLESMQKEVCLLRKGSMTIRMLTMKEGIRRKQRPCPSGLATNFYFNVKPLHDL